jgi:hypothetical protein
MVLVLPTKFKHRHEMIRAQPSHFISAGAIGIWQPMKATSRRTPGRASPRQVMRYGAGQSDLPQPCESLFALFRRLLLSCELVALGGARAAFALARDWLCCDCSVNGRSPRRAHGLKLALGLFAGHRESRRNRVIEMIQTSTQEHRLPEIFSPERSCGF